MAVYRRLGAYRPRGMGRCGLCGQHRKMTEAHVPPRAVGNDGGRRERGIWEVTEAGARVGSWARGGLSVYGLCMDCNGVTSGESDRAYVAFHNRMLSLDRRLVLDPRESPVRVAPGLVARSVLAGMFAVNDALQERFPHLARGLREDQEDLSLGHDLLLKLALTSGPYSRLGGPVGYMRVLTVREFHIPQAEIWFPPLAWCLRSSRATDPTLGRELTSGWGDATEWIRYGRAVSTDLRNVVGKLPLVAAPRLGAEEWVVLSSDKMMTALEGRPRG